MAKLFHGPLNQLLQRGADLWWRLDHRQALLAEMQDLGAHIDDAYRRFERSPQRDTNVAELQQAQSSAQKRIEEKRSEAEGIALHCIALQRSAASTTKTSTRRFSNSHRARPPCFR